MSLFTKKSDAYAGDVDSPKKGGSKLSLLILLLLVGGFGYLYFFTNLIVPQETAPAKAPAPVGAPEVKQSMPPKPATPPATQPAATAAEAKKEETKPAQSGASQPAAAPPPAPVKPAAAQAAAPVPPAKPAPAAPPTAAPAKPAPPVPAAPQPAVAKPAAPAPAPPAPKKEEAKPAKPADVKATAPKKEEAKPGKVGEAAAKPVEKKKTVSYTLVLADVQSGEQSAAVEAKLARHKLKPVVKQPEKQGRKMIRLYYGAYTDYDEYRGALDKLKQSAAGAFAVEKDGTYSVYAGSFGNQAGAEKELKNLQAKGVAVKLQPIDLGGGTLKYTAGRFKTKGDADKAAAALKKDGLAVRVVPGKE